MLYRMIFKFLLQYFIYVIILIWYIYHVLNIQTKPFVKVMHPDKDAKKKAEKITSVVLIIAISLFYIFVGFESLYLQTKDLPSILSGNYEYVEGYILNTAAERRYNSRRKAFLARTIIVGSSIDSEQGTTIYIPDNANRGEHVKCCYLKNSHFGYIQERIGN